MLINENIESSKKQREDISQKPYAIPLKVKGKSLHNNLELKSWIKDKVKTEKGISFKNLIIQIGYKNDSAIHDMFRCTEDIGWLTIAKFLDALDYEFYIRKKKK